MTVQARLGQYYQYQGDISAEELVGKTLVAITNLRHARWWDLNHADIYQQSVIMMEEVQAY